MRGSSTQTLTTPLLHQQQRQLVYLKPRCHRPELSQTHKNILSGPYIDRQPIYYTTLALRSTPLSPEDVLVDTKARFAANLQQPKSMSELWSAYLAVRDSTTTSTTITNNENDIKNNVITIDDYEQLMRHLHYHAQQVRRSINWQRMVQVYQDAVSSLSKDDMTNKAMMLMAIAAYGRTAGWESAQQTFIKLKEQGWADELAYCHIVEAALNTNRPEDAYELFQTGKPIMSQEIITHCLDRYLDINIKKRNMTRAMVVIQEWMPEPTEQLAKTLWTGYVQLMKRHGGLLVEEDNELHLWEDMEAFVGEFGRRVSDTISLSPSVQAIFTAKHLGILMDIWTRAYPERVLSQKTFDGLLAIYAAEGDVRRLKEALTTMHQHDIQPTQHMLNALLKMSSLTTANPLSPSYIKSLLKSSNKSNRLDKEGYGSFIQAFVNAGDLESAQRVALQMKRRPFPIGTNSHMAIVQGWVRRGQMEKAEAWLEKSHYTKWAKRKCQSALDPYAVIAEGYLQQGEWDKCVNLMKHIKKETPTVAQQNRRMIKAVLAARLARGDFKGSEQMLLSKEIDFTPMTILRITQAMLGIKNKSVPGESAVKGLELMETVLDLRVTGTGLCRIIEKLGERGDLRAAYDLYKRVRNERRPSLGISIYHTMIEAAVNNNDIPMAEKIIHHMNRSSSVSSTAATTAETNCQQKCPSLSSYNMLLNVYASREPEPHLSRMTQTFRRLLADGHKPDVTTYNILIKAFVQKANQNAALSIFHDMEASGYRANSWTINTMIHGWIAQMDWGGLQQFIGDIKKRGYVLDTVTFNLMLEGLLRLNKHDIRIAKLWKRQNRWPKLKKQQQDSEKNGYISLPSEAVWEIFESALGIKRTDLSITGKSTVTQGQEKEKDNVKMNNIRTMDRQEVCKILIQHQQKETSTQIFSRASSSGGGNGGAFYTLFQDAKPDEVTFKLFMKAFNNSNDPESAAKIHYFWMNQQKKH
ncbi:hypothetical protein INT45_004164 [Circinella minor]|uniref:Pentacotripeptide-repeat region of PRORP domain-containing protein n=1 Tax=Circinella minor TaxID=1195481 RepID=A0A8H7S315_9FUNG|nr:hypothetical protein INT45_004164 [Circinella minor]